MSPPPSLSERSPLVHARLGFANYQLRTAWSVNLFPLSITWKDAKVHFFNLLVMKTRRGLWHRYILEKEAETFTENLQSHGFSSKHSRYVASPMSFALQGTPKWNL
jgi:hypothetical protein